jgi:hypothetical protein
MNIFWYINNKHAETQIQIQISSMKMKFKWALAKLGFHKINENYKILMKYIKT